MNASVTILFVMVIVLLLMLIVLITRVKKMKYIKTRKEVCIIVVVLGVLFLILLIMEKNPTYDTTKEVHIILVATEADKADQLLASLSTKKGYKVHIKGVGEEWSGYDFKLRHTLALAKTLKPDDILMHLDAYDTYVLAHSHEVLEKFYNMDANIVVSTEKTLAPVPEFHRDNKLEVMDNLYPTAPNSYRWINSGTYIGYAGAIENVLSVMPQNFHCDMPTGEKTNTSDDQRCFHTLFIKDGVKNNIKLDYNQDIFHCMWDVHHYSLEPTRLFSETGSRPCVLHGNGPNPASYTDAVKTFKSRGN
jgi:hypothetical protein